MAPFKLDSDYWKDSEELAKKADQYFNYPYVVVPFAYSSSRYGTAPVRAWSTYSANSYADVVKPELKGKTIASDLTKSFTYVNTAISLQENGVTSRPCGPSSRRPIRSSSSAPSRRCRWWSPASVRSTCGT